jgi:hypothetical protein
MYIMGKSFTNLMLFSHKIPIINTLFPPLCEMLYAIYIKIFAEALELFTHCFSASRPQNGVLGMHPSGGQKDGSWIVLNLLSNLQ